MHQQAAKVNNSCVLHAPIIQSFLRVLDLNGGNQKELLSSGKQTYTTPQFLKALVTTTNQSTTVTI